MLARHLVDLCCFFGVVGVLCSVGIAQHCDRESGGCEYDEANYNIPSGIWSGNKKFQQAIPLLTDVQTIVDLLLTDMKAAITNIDSDLDRIFHKLHTGTIEVGIVGLQKAGKSTFLNALLGKTFLPSSVESQTATEVIIIHDASKPDGTLYCATGDGIVQIAEGEEIYDELLNRNKEVRSQTDLGLVDCDKLILRAPFPFLLERGIRDIQVQFSDTPGFAEAGKVFVSESIRLAVQEMSAFILILNSEYMGSISEAHLLGNMSESHPDLFSKLNRVLILVNGREGIYRAGSSSSPKSVTPKDIPEYVSKYLQTEDFLNLDEELPADKVLLFNALWGLNCQQQSTWTKIEYDEALQMLRYNDINLQEDTYKEMSSENIKAVCDSLVPISAIKEVEERIWQTMIANGPKILLESVVDDTIGVVNNNLIPALEDLIVKEEVPQRTNTVNSLKQLSSLVEELLKEGAKEFDSISASTVRSFITQNRDKVRNFMATLIDSKAASLHGLKHDNTEGIMGPMRNIRDSVPGEVKTKARGDWNTLTQNIRDTLTKEGHSLLVKLKDRFTARISQSGSTEQHITTAIINSFKQADTSLSVSSVPQNFPLESMGINSSPLQNPALGSYVQPLTETRYRSVQRKKCKKKWFKKKCKKWYENEPYNVKVYGPVVSSFKSAFDGTINDWAGQYNRLAESYSQDVSRAVASSGREKLNSMFANPKKIVAEALESSKKALSESSGHAQFLSDQKDKLFGLASNLGEVMNEQ